MDLLILTFLTGLVLSVSAAFRLFIPLLIGSIAARSGYLNLGLGFTWIATDIALLAFAIAVSLEVFASYWRKGSNGLNPKFLWLGVIVIGTVVTAASALGVSPTWQWGIGAIVGGSMAAIARFAIPAESLDHPNSVIATAITVAALMLSVLAVLWPFLGFTVGTGLIPG